MAADVRLDTYGLQDALKKMQKLNPAMRRTLLKDTKEAAKPLVDAINAVGASASDLVAILDALHEAGALHAELIVI